MDGIKINKRPRLRNPYLICAWPGMGEVAFKAASYLAEKLNAEEFAEIMPRDYFYLTGSVVKAGILSAPELPYGKFYYWKHKAGKRDLVIFLSNAQPDLSRAEEYSRNITWLARQLGIKTIITFASMPQPIEHTQAPGVYFAATTPELNRRLKELNLNLLSEGQISGMNGLFLGIAKKEGFEGYCLLGEIPLYTIQVENPKASYAVLDALRRILNIQIDFTDLIDQTHIMEGEINKLLDYLKVGFQSPGPIGEDEVEKIKKTLGQLSKLPLSVKEKIEKLFELSRADISKANELKAELDKWNVYKEYEDRFLDLFRRSEDRNN